MSQPSSSSKDDETNAGLIVGITLGVVILLILLGLIYYLFIKKKDNVIDNDGSVTNMGFNPNHTDNSVEIYGNNNY